MAHGAVRVWAVRGGWRRNGPVSHSGSHGPSTTCPLPFMLQLQSVAAKPPPVRPCPHGRALSVPQCRGGSCIASQKIGVGARLLLAGTRAPQEAHALAAQARGTFQSGQWRCNCEPRRVGCGAMEPRARRARVHSLPRVRRARNAARESRPQRRAQWRSAAAAASATSCVTCRGLVCDGAPVESDAGV